MRGPPPPGRRRSPPGGLGRDDPAAFPPPPPMHGRRRGRSPSPPFRRSPPPKRYRRDDYDDRFGPSGAPGPDRYGDRPFDRRGPPPLPGPGGYGRRYPDDRYPDDRYGAPDDRYGPPDDRYGGRAARSPPRSRVPMPFKQFLLELPDDVTPEQAQQRYDDYRADFWGSEFRAYFEAHKDEYAMRQRFDPREHLKAVDLRAEAAAAAAAKLSESIAKGELDPAMEGFNQGNGPAALAKPDTETEVAISAAKPDGDEAAADVPKGNGADAKQMEGAKRKVAPELCWTSERVAVDLKLSRELVAKLDSEKGITDNPLLAAEAPAAAPAAGKDDTATAEDNATAEDTAAAKDADGDAAMDAGDAKDGDADAPAEANGAQPPPHGAEPSHEQQVGKLDRLLTWLWRVHGVDYYAGTEVAEPDEEQRAGPRPTLRCPRPEEGEQADDKLASEQAAALEKGIDAAWRKRIEQGDPFEKLLQKEKLATYIDKWIEDQIIKYEERKWGSRVSQKLFMDKEYVVKHIRNKHKDKIDEQKQAFWDEQYWQNFKAEREEEQRRNREAAQRARQLREGGGMPGDEPPQQGLLRGGSLDGLPALASMGLGMFGGRGLPAAGLPGLPDLPPGMMLVPVEGAGPQGPFVPVPIPAGGAAALAGPAGIRPQPPPPRGARPPMMMGGGMGRMAMNGGMFMPHRAADYQDLDDPKNNRSVLDYGDL